MIVNSCLVKLFHFLAAVQFFYGLYYETVHVLPEELKLRKFSFGGKLIYLTFIDAIFHACYHTIALINDFFGTNEAEPKHSPVIRRIRDYIFTTFTFPLGMNVTILFWGLYAIDRELVFPRVMDPIYPWWLNHILHTNVFVFMAVEMFILYHHSSNRKAEMAGLSIFIVAYIGWVHVVRLVAGAWVYPVLYVLDLHHRIGFFILVATLPIVFYFAGQFINKQLWTKQRLAHEKHHAS